MFWTLIGIIAATLTMFGFVPQGIKMLRTKSAKDVSMLTLLQFSIGGTLWMLYGIYLNDYIIIGANAVSLFTLLFDLGIYMKLNGGNLSSHHDGE
jgi:MtN3 and saliva related transmembrane protein